VIHSLRRIAIFVVLCSATALGPSSGQAHSTTTGSQGTTAAAQGIYWGAYVAGGQYGLVDAPWNMASANRFEANTGKRMSLLEWGQDWYECSSSCGMRGFRADLMSKARARGYLPVLSWGSYEEAKAEDQPDYALSEIISGRYDSFIKSWALGAKQWGLPFFLRFDWEMNTNEVPYSEHSNGNRSGEFVQMWRHVHDIFDEVGARNVTWVWCPNVEYAGSVKPLASLYPGDRYVDWTCLDGYNWGTGSSHEGGWMSFSTVFRHTYDLLTKRIARSKPLMIGETSSSELGGSKAAWITDALGTQIPTRFPKVAAVVWFNKEYDSQNWAIESSQGAEAAMRAALQSPVYLGDRFRRAPSGVIRALR
jgi:hypothetical protein